MYKFLLRQRMKKGFTIVELVIVIAVIAILSAILIPTFVNISKSARVAADQAAAKNMNEILAIATAQGKKVDNMTDVLKIVNDGGYVIENLNPTAQGYHYVWDSESNQILYLDDSYNVAYSSKTYSKSGLDWWCTVKTTEEMSLVASHGINLYYGAEISGAVTLTKLVNINTGYFSHAGGIVTINDSAATNSNGVNYLIKGTFNGMDINCGAASIDLYGSVENLTVTSISSNTLNVYGQVKSLIAKAVGIKVQPSGYVGTLKSAGSDEVVEVVNNGVINETEANTKVNNNGTVNHGADNTVTGENKPVNIEIATLSDLENFRDQVNNGRTYADFTVTLTADIDMSNTPWTPIGDNALKPFCGTFDGNNHKIVGLTANGYNPNPANVFTTSSTKTKGFAYGLFGWVAGTVIIKDLSMEKVNIDFAEGSCVGSIVGFAAESDTKYAGSKNPASISLTLINCSASGTVKAQNDVGGLVGKCYSSDSFTMTNCTNNANITAEISGKAVKAGGLVGFACTVGTFNECKNTGNVTVLANTSSSTGDTTAMAGGLAGGLAGRSNGIPPKYEISTYSNSGKITVTNVTNGSRAAGEVVGRTVVLTLKGSIVLSGSCEGDTVSSVGFNQGNDKYSGVCFALNYLNHTFIGISTTTITAGDNLTYNNTAVSGAFSCAKPDNTWKKVTEQTQNWK